MKSIKHYTKGCSRRGQKDMGAKTSQGGKVIQLRGEWKINILFNHKFNCLPC